MRGRRLLYRPHRAVEKAVVTHAHSDHARRGSRQYYCESSGQGLLKVRLGQKIQVECFPYQQKFKLGAVEVSFHSAGHILGSSQIRIQKGSDVWLVTGDFKREHDPSCEPFEVVKCDTLITEATFGTHKYIWNKNIQHGKQIYEWWMENAAHGHNSILFGYSLGKAQRILAELSPFADRPIVIHESITELTECYRLEKRQLAPTIPINDLPSLIKLEGQLILAPPSILKTNWTEQLGVFKTAFASGWMLNSSQTHGRSYDFGFVMSDHADWNDLNETITQSGAEQVFVLHRSNGVLIRHLRKQGLDAHPVSELTPENYQKLSPTNLKLFNYDSFKKTRRSSCA